MPSRYEEIKDTLAMRLAAERIERLGGSLATCLRELLLPER